MATTTKPSIPLGDRRNKRGAAWIREQFASISQDEPSPELHARLLAIVAQVQQGEFARACAMQPQPGWTDAQIAGYLSAGRA